MPSSLCVCFVNFSLYILSEITITLSNLFHTDSFLYSFFVDVNVDVEKSMHRDLVTSNKFINYKVLPAFDLDLIELDSSQLHQIYISMHI